MDDGPGRKIVMGGAAFMAALAALLFALATVVVSRSARAAVAPVGPAVAGFEPGDHEFRLAFGGFERSYLVHVPAGVGSKSKTKPAADGHDGTVGTADDIGKEGTLPVVMVLHGAGGSGAQVEKQTGWGKKADEEHFFAIFPDALPAMPRLPATFATNPRFWNDHSGRGTEIHNQIDDVAFLEAVYDDVEKRFPADKKREFLTGFSSGGSMTFLAAIKLCERIAAAAPVSGLLWSHDGLLSRAVPLLMIFGDKDPLNPWDGGMGKTPWNAEGRLQPPVTQSVEAWAKVTGCPETPVPIEDKGGVKRVAYGPGHNGAEFIFVRVEGAGHCWPGGKETLPESMTGPRSDKLDATDAIWKFFARHLDAPRTPVAP